MTRIRPLLRRSRAVPAVAAAAAAAIATAMLVAPGTASAHHPTPAHAVPAPPAVPTSADQIQNLDQVKTAIKGYYGDTADANTVDPVTGNEDLHTFSPAGSYAHEVQGIVADSEKYLKKPNPPGSHGSKGSKGAPKAILFDVDDTTLNTYNYEIFSNFVYNPDTNAAFVNAGVFPAVPGMAGLEHTAEAEGYQVYFLTGRPESQRAGTVSNLTNVGFDVDSSHLFLKDLANPIYSSCAPSCTTIQYKSLTRRYIESQLGVDIVANFGDQYSDLIGGYADKTVKIPNPMYYLP